MNAMRRSRASRAPRRGVAYALALALAFAAACAAPRLAAAASGKPCPTRAQPPPQTALRLPDDVGGASVAAVELVLVDGSKVTVTRDAAVGGLVPGGTRYGGAPVGLGAGVRPGDVAEATVLLRGGKRVALDVPAPFVAAPDPVGCWRPRKDGPRRAGATWGAFDPAAQRVLPAVVPAAGGLLFKKDLPAAFLLAHKAAGKSGMAVDVVRGDGSVGSSADGTAADGTGVLGQFLSPVFAGGK